MGLTAIVSSEHGWSGGFRPVYHIFSSIKQPEWPHSVFTSGFNSYHVGRPIFNKPLFTPNYNNEAAVTSGQIENFNKALEEEAEEAIKEQYGNNESSQETFFPSGDEPPKSYVSVSFGSLGNNAHYGYTV